MPAYELENDYVVKIHMQGEVVYAMMGSMIAYKGEVTFQRSFLSGGGISNMAMRQATNEGMAMMAAQGSGVVYYAHRGQNVTIVPVRSGMLCIESKSVLAFDGRLQAGTRFMGNGGVSSIVSGMATGQGLFTSTFTGTGEVAMVSDGKAIPLEVMPNRPVFVDPQAYLGHVGNLNPSIHTDVGWKTLIGQTSGESYQLKFQGQGTVYIQASER